MALFDKHTPQMKSISVVDWVVDFITEAIISRKLKPGDKLPSEVVLSEKLGVGRNSIREAIKILATYGILEVRSRTEGTYVCGGFQEKMLDPLIYGIIMEQGTGQNIIDLRRIIETGTIQAVIENATENDLKELKVILDELIYCLNQENADPKELLGLDLKFHEKIELSVYNPLLSKVSAIITKLTMHSRLRTIEVLVDNNQKQYLIDTHKNIYDVIKSRDGSQVSKVIEQSFQHWRIVLDGEKD